MYSLKMANSLKGKRQSKGRDYVLNARDDAKFGGRMLHVWIKSLSFLFLVLSQLSSSLATRTTKAADISQSSELELHSVKLRPHCPQIS